MEDDDWEDLIEDEFEERWATGDKVIIIGKDVSPARARLHRLLGSRSQPTHKTTEQSGETDDGQQNL